MTESIIQPDGSLRIIVRHQDVSWFDFLRHSRSCRARDWGWNSRRYWGPRGVDVLVANLAATVSQWTKQSLSANAAPPPRIGNFMLNREHTLDRLALPEIDSSMAYSENALSFSTFRKYADAVGDNRFLGVIDLIGYEIPLGEERRRQLKVDLLGLSFNPVPTIEIIELKDADNTGDSPLMALTEGICYALQILRCKNALLGELFALPAILEGTGRVKPFSSAETDFRNINIRLAAPKAYWDLWFRPPLIRSTVESKMREIVDGVNTELAAADERFRSALSLHFAEI